MNASDDVLNFLCDRRFHRQFTLPADPSAGRPAPTRLSYSDYGDASSTRVVLFIGGLMGSRISYAPLDQLATKHGIRIIHADRPGTGGSSAVPLSSRLETYVRALPLLLAHLEISHVALAAHSFGTVYALNVLLLCPQLLHPRRPYVAFFAPWVHPRHSRVTHLQAAEMLPASLIGRFTSVARFVNGSVMPLAGLSAGLGSAVMKGVRGSVGSANGVVGHGGRSLDLSDAETLERLRDLIPTFLFAEEMEGVNQDTQLCLRKPREVPWCVSPLVWDDVDEAVRVLGGIVRNEQTSKLGARVWSVDAFHAETDVMVGNKGQAWFDTCWGAGNLAEAKFSRQVVAGADHDFILDPGFGGSDKWLQRVRSMFEEGDGERIDS